MESKIFYSATHERIAAAVKKFLNSQKDFMSVGTSSSPRAAGDAIEELLSKNFGAILGNLAKDYSSSFARRAMADFAFYDNDGFYNVVDVKTHRLETSFNMPNLTSIERLSRFYEDDKNYFVILNIAYSLKGTHIEIKEVHFVPIEFLSWNCLTIGALGWGQIQIANSNTIEIVPQSRKKWMLQLCDALAEFYPHEISKITERIKHFEKIKKFWLKKAGA